MNFQCDLHQSQTLQNIGKITNFLEATLHDRLGHNFAVNPAIVEVADIYDCALKHWYTQGFHISFDMPN